MNEGKEAQPRPCNQTDSVDRNSAIEGDAMELSETLPTDFSGLLFIEQLCNCEHQKPTELFIAYSNVLTDSESEESTTIASDSNFFFNYVKVTDKAELFYIQ